MDDVSNILLAFFIMNPANYCCQQLDLKKIEDQRMTTLHCQLNLQYTAVANYLQS